MLEYNDPTALVLILSDINMSSMSRLELLRIVKDKYPELKVFMITAYDDERNRSTAQGYGCDKYLIEPIDFGLLKEQIIVIVFSNKLIKAKYD